MPGPRCQGHPALAHVPEKWVPVLQKDIANADSGAHPDSTDRDALLVEAALAAVQRALARIAVVDMQIVAHSRPRGTLRVRRNYGLRGPGFPRRSPAEEPPVETLDPAAGWSRFRRYSRIDSAVVQCGRTTADFVEGAKTTMLVLKRSMTFGRSAGRSGWRPYWRAARRSPGWGSLRPGSSACSSPHRR